jgi:hypothetical protein
LRKRVGALEIRLGIMPRMAYSTILEFIRVRRSIAPGRRAA